MHNRSLYNFYRTYGRDRMLQLVELLNDGKPAPQQRIAELIGVSKSQVSQWLKNWIVWKAEFTPEAREELEYILHFEASNVKMHQERLEKIPKTSVSGSATPVFELSHSG
jgi:predicted transcriptional regulator